MQKYKPKTPLANVSDRVLRVMITWRAGDRVVCVPVGHAPYRPDGGRRVRGTAVAVRPAIREKKHDAA